MAKSPLFNNLQGLLRSPSRRRFLQLSAAAGSLYLLADYERYLPRSKEPVVIIGAGAAGLAAALELQKNNVPYVIYESAGRHGGRVYTQENFNKDGMFCELGGEWLDAHHEYVFEIAKELGVEIEALKDEGKVHEAFYFKNQFLHESDIAPGFKKLKAAVKADCDKIFAGQPEDAMVNYQTFNEAGKHFDHMTLEAYFKTLKHIDPFIIDLVRVAYVSEYGLEADKQSALNLLLLVDTESEDSVEMYGGDEGWRVKGGNSKLINAMVEKVSKGGDIQMAHHLVGISEKNSKLVLNFQHNGISKEVYANKVICTIPFPVLRNIDGVDKLNLSERKKVAVRDFAMGTNSKMIAGFSERFWLDKFSGQVYTQTKSQMFWDSSRKQPGSSGIITNYSGGDFGREAGDSQFADVFRDLSKLFPNEKKYRTEDKSVANWSRSSLTLGSYACPTPGSYTSFLGSLHTPELDNKLFFAGEHTSEIFLGYINGALESGRDAAQQIVTQLKLA